MGRLGFAMALGSPRNAWEMSMSERGPSNILFIVGIGLIIAGAVIYGVLALMALVILPYLKTRFVDDGCRNAALTQTNTAPGLRWS